MSGTGQSVEGNVNIDSNPTLQSLDGLIALETVHGTMSVRSNDALASLSLPNLTSVGGGLIVGDGAGYGNETLSLLALPNLTTVGGDHAPNVGGDLGIAGNPSLTSLAGLGALTSVGGALCVFEDPTLPQCEVCDVFAQLGGATGLRSFANQADTCNDSCI